MLAENRERIDSALKSVLRLALGGTAVGTGINAASGFAEAVAADAPASISTYSPPASVTSARTERGRTGDIARRVGVVMGRFVTTIAYAEDSGIRGHVDTVARAFSVANPQPGNLPQSTGALPVRLARRFPVRIHLDDVPLILIGGAHVAVGALVVCIFVGIIVTSVADRLQLPVGHSAFCSCSHDTGLLSVPHCERRCRIGFDRERALAHLLTSIVANDTTAF